MIVPDNLVEKTYREIGHVFFSKDNDLHVKHVDSIKKDVDQNAAFNMAMKSLKEIFWGNCYQNFQLKSTLWWLYEIVQKTASREIKNDMLLKNLKEFVADLNWEIHQKQDEINFLHNGEACIYNIIYFSRIYQIADLDRSLLDLSQMIDEVIHTGEPSQHVIMCGIILGFLYFIVILGMFIERSYSDDHTSHSSKDILSKLISLAKRAPIEVWAGYDLSWYMLHIVTLQNDEDWNKFMNNLYDTLLEIKEELSY